MGDFENRKRLNGTKDHKTDSPAQKCGSRMLLVLGPHRSGTSLTARMLECLGAVNLNKLVPPQPDNPKGYFEDSEVNFFNQETLLPALGADWSSVGPIDWPDAGSSLTPLRERALEILRQNYDPRSRSPAPICTSNFSASALPISGSF